ncbi:Protein of unknown function [Gryllus bimaculatus]|nr:Protein of unknown function [Gryllus bimaculatus]
MIPPASVAAAAAARRDAVPQLVRRVAALRRNVHRRGLRALRAVLVAVTVFYALQAAVNVLLLFGAMQILDPSSNPQCFPSRAQENACLLYPWITVYSFVVIINLMVCAVVPATFFSHGFSLDGVFAILGSILNIGSQRYSSSR